MKKILLSLAFAAASFGSAMAQNAQDAAAAAAQAISEAAQETVNTPKPKYWTNSIVLDLGVNQTQLVNWAAGGYNTITLNAGLDAKANYVKQLASWTNRLQMQYGFLYSDEKVGLLQKSTDRLYLESKFAYRTNSSDSKWSYSAAYDFRTQFTDNFDSYKKDDEGNWTGTLKSGFLSPAYMNLGFGMDWVPNEWFNVNFAPITGSLTMVRDTSLRKNYGLELSKEGLDANVGANYNTTIFKLGAQVKDNLKIKINDNLGFETQLVLFSNYLKDPQNMRVNLDNKLSWQLTKFFKLGFNTWLIYDPDVLIADKSGANHTQRVQFKEFLTFNFTWTFANGK